MFLRVVVVARVTIISTVTKKENGTLCVPCLIFTRHANGMLIIVTAQRSMASLILLVSSPLSFPLPPPLPLPAVCPLAAPAMRKSFCNEYIVCISFSQAPDDQCNAGWALMMFQLGQSSHLINRKKSCFCLWKEKKNYK